MNVALVCLLAVLLDALLGEPKRLHPLVGFGKLASWLESHLNRSQNGYGERLRGVIAVVLVTLPFVFIVYLALQFTSATMIIEIVILYLAIAPRSLAEHAADVEEALVRDDLLLARQRVSQIVSRDTADLGEAQIASATVESVLENGSDALFSALFWYLVAGAPGVVLYRLANTLDAMWGYRNERFRQFGWAAARFDDLLNYLPARLTAFSYACVGDYRTAYHCWASQAATWYSPNAGPVMAAGAGALNLQLGGPESYHGQIKIRPPLGIGATPIHTDINRAVGLVRRALLLWLVLILIGGVIYG